MAQSSPSTPTGARCRAHDQKAAETCGRCGDFACAACLIDEERLCPACRELRQASGFPFSRENWSFIALVKDAVDSYTRERGSLILSALSLTALYWSLALAGIVGAYWYAGGENAPRYLLDTYLLRVIVASYPLGAFLMLALTRSCLDVAARRRFEVGSLLSLLRRLPRVLAHAVVASSVLGAIALATIGLVIGVAVGSRAVFADLDSPAGASFTALFLLVYALSLGVFALLAAPLILAPIEMLHNPAAGPLQSTLNAFTIARGHRLAILGLALFLGLGLWMCYGLSCVGGFAIAPLLHLVHVNVFLALRDGSGLPPVRRAS